MLDKVFKRQAGRFWRHITRGPRPHISQGQYRPLGLRMSLRRYRRTLRSRAPATAERRLWTTPGATCHSKRSSRHFSATTPGWLRITAESTASGRKHCLRLIRRRRTDALLDRPRQCASVLPISPLRDEFHHAEIADLVKRSPAQSKRRC